mgnify:CR=1 FL=1
MHKRTQYLLNVSLICKKEFHPFRKEAKYCSNECNGFSRRKGKYIKCFYCGEKIYRKRQYLKKRELFFCSRKCQGLNLRYTNANRELRNQARYAVRRGIEKGEIKRKNCEICMESDTSTHHYLGYEKEHWLDIQWLCRRHHILEHHRLSKNKGRKLK